VADFPRYPGHTQAAEQTVKLVTEASASVCGEKGWINLFVSHWSSAK